VLCCSSLYALNRWGKSKKMLKRADNIHDI